MFSGVRVPLISPIIAVIYRLNIQATWNVDPPGDEYSEGFDDIMREPVVSRTAGVRSVPRVEHTPIEVPAQFETATYEQLRAAFGGDDPVTNIVFVFHREDLENEGLLDTNRDCKLKKGDRIDRIKKGGRTTRTFAKPLYIYELRPGSEGFGPDGYDLELAYTTYRAADPLNR